MKDPLRYYLDEGFGAIFAIRREDGACVGDIRYHKLNTDFIPVQASFDGVIAMGFPKYNRYYTINSELFEKYGTIYNSKEEAAAAIAKYDAECSETIKFMETAKDLIA